MAMYCCEAANSYPICSFSLSMKLMALLSGTPAKADCAGAGRQRTRREPGRRVGVVVARGRHVVRRVRVEERGEVLDVAAARAELELAAAVHADAALLAVVVGLAQLAQATDPGRLHVHHAGRERERLDVGD